MLRAADSVARQPLVEVVNAAFSYPERTVLNGVNFHVSSGEIVVLLGPNGAGKSTLSKVICGRLPLQSGETRVNGACPMKSPDVRGIIGLVPQTIALYEKLTVRENLQIFGKLMRVPKDALRPRTEKTLLDIGLSERGDTIISTLSGGMQRRVNIGVALMHNPALLVLDEPTAGVDYEARAQLAGVLRTLRDKGLAILLTTHDMEEAEVLADRVAIMTNGQIQACGRPSDLIDQVFRSSRELRVVTTSCQYENTPAEEETLLVSVDDPKLGELLNACANSTNEIEELRLRRPDLQSLVEYIYANGARA